MTITALIKVTMAVILRGQCSTMPRQLKTNECSLLQPFTHISDASLDGTMPVSLVITWAAPLRTPPGISRPREDIQVLLGPNDFLGEGVRR